MRLFIAINLPPLERRAIRTATTRMRSATREAGIVWVAEDCLHMTLKFLGEQNGEAAAKVTRALAAVAERHRTLSLELGGLGAFPNLRRPRTIWLAISPDTRLELLHHDVESACGELGYDVDGRPFKPHLTLGRVKRQLSSSAARDLTTAARAVRYRGECRVSSVDLMSSELLSSGPRYSLIAAARFGAQ